MRIIQSLLIIVLGILLRFIYEGQNPDCATFLNRVSISSNDVNWRMFQAVGYQIFGFNPVCTSNKSLEGQLILITGGNSGIGYETALDLVKRRANVIISSRNVEKGKAAVNSIKEEMKLDSKFVGSVEFIHLDLSDMNSVIALTNELKHLYPTRQLDQFIANSALWPTEYGKSVNGYEMAYATNVLGHHLLFRKLYENNQLKTNAKVLLVTGDIYITVKNTNDISCTPNFEYETSFDNNSLAYSRSKLGIMWLSQEYRQRYPSLQVNVIHPGVMYNELVILKEKDKSANPSIAEFLSTTFLKSLLLSNQQGAQTTIAVASAPSMRDGSGSGSGSGDSREGQLVNGAYYHNTLGRLVLNDDDIANLSSLSRRTSDLSTSARSFYQELEYIIQDYVFGEKEVTDF